MSGSFQDGFADNHNNLNCGAGTSVEPTKKRRMNEANDIESPNSVYIRGRSFLPIRSSSSIFHADDWKPSGTSLFCPVSNDVYVNMTKYDQVSAAQGSFYTADDSGNFSKMMMGHVIHMWRFDKTQKKRYISQSFLFTNFQEFMNIQSFLQNV